MNGSSPPSSYQSYAPSPALAGVVDVVWIQECGAMPGHKPTTIVPTGRVELIFHYGDPFQQYGVDEPTLMPRCHVVGQQQSPILVGATGSTGIAIVRFTPWGASALFGDELANIKGQLVDLELLWKATPLRNLLEKLHAAQSTRDCADIVDEFVVSRLIESRFDRLAMASVLCINEGWGRHRVEDIARRFELGRRQFTRRFTRNIGASPKQMSRVLRAQKAIACVRLGENVQDIIARCGFADQSHFVREVASHCKQPPSKLADLSCSRMQKFFNSNNPGKYCGVVYL